MKQLTQKWHDYRGRRITASQFACVLAKPTTKRYLEYMEDIIESINGVPYFDCEKPWFRHGKEMEPEALSFYEWRMQRNIERFGGDNPKLFIHPKYNFIGCSPDGFDGLDGGVEIKCHKSLNQFLMSEEKGIPTQYIPQVQGSLWITERKWWNFVSYYRKEETRLIHIHCVYPDLDYHKMLEEKCLNFWEKIQGKIK